MPHRRFDLRTLRLLRLCVAGGLAVVAALWATSFWQSLSLRLGDRYSIHSHRGTVQVHVESASELAYDAAGNARVVEITPREYHGKGELPTVRMHLSAWRPVSTGAIYSGGSIALTGGNTLNYGYRLDAWGMPHWVLATPLALLLVPLLMLEQRRRRLIAAGHCLTCGYDLRATPEKCPECGEGVSGAVT